MTAVARTFACPGCGAAVDEQKRHCPYCAVPVATVRCARCFHMNVPAALHCSGCGDELGLEPIAEPDEVVCPDCRQPMTAFRAESGVLRDCDGCGGQFVEHRLLRELLERREVLGDEVPQRPPRSSAAVAGPPSVRYVPCPLCGTRMNRKNFGGTSGVIVDICRPHGVWLDAGELPRVLQFVAEGGLARARRREAEQLAEQRKDVAARARALAIDSPSNAQLDLGAQSATGLVDLLMELLR